MAGECDGTCEHPMIWHGQRGCLVKGCPCPVQRQEQFGPAAFRPRKGWPPDRSPWWCSRCRVVWFGLYPWMHGGCPQSRPGGRCGTILYRVC
jgi:hypothetical protein